MARYIKANRKVAAFLGLEVDRNTVKDGNYLLWQNDMLAFGPLTQLAETLQQIGGIALLAHEAREEQDGTVTRPLPTPTDPRFVIETEPEAEEVTESDENNAVGEVDETTGETPADGTGEATDETGETTDEAGEQQPAEETTESDENNAAGEVNETTDENNAAGEVNETTDETPADGTGEAGETTEETNNNTEG